jgi:hypothetical protein
MTLALEDPEIGAPGADGFAVLVSHYAGKLVEMGKVVRSPGGQKLRQTHRAKDRMAAAAVKVGGLEVQGCKFAKIFRADAREFIEQVSEGLAPNFALVAAPIERLEGPRFAVLKDHLRARNPISAFTVEQVSDNIERSERVFAFVVQNPGVWKIAKKGVESGRGARKKRCGLVKGLLHSQYSARVILFGLGKGHVNAQTNHTDTGSQTLSRVKPRIALKLSGQKSRENDDKKIRGGIERDR